MTCNLSSAVAIHKFVISFCMGLELRVVHTSLIFHVLYVFVFAIMSALGIGIGVLLALDKEEKGQDRTQEYHTTVATLQGDIMGKNN